MPLIIKDFQWRQTETLVIIHVPLHGVHQSKVNIFTSSKYIKASFEKCFFEVFLLHNIKPSESKCTKTTQDITFELKKEIFSLWEKLEIDMTNNEKQIYKHKLINEELEQLQQQCKNKSENKYALKREAVRQQISLDTKQRNSIDKIKNDEKACALGDLHDWNNIPIDKESKNISTFADEKIDSKLQNLKQKISLKKTKFNFESQHESATLIPSPRKSVTFAVTFTNRQFPTPSRESQLEEENEWLRKQTEVRRSVGFVSEDLRPEEKNPQYLNLKGLEFLKSGNLLGAISAFSFGIRLTDKFSDLFINRSKAHFQKGNYYKCVQDCSKALELLQPVVSANYNDRVDCIVRRGLALCKMDLIKEGVSELEVAYKLRPDNISIKKKLCEAIDQLNNTSNGNS